MEDPTLLFSVGSTVEVRFLRCCVDPNAPQEPLDADAQAEVDGGDGGGEAPLDEEE